MREAVCYADRLSVNIEKFPLFPAKTIAPDKKHEDLQSPCF